MQVRSNPAARIIGGSVRIFRRGDGPIVDLSTRAASVEGTWARSGPKRK
jgi:hypothetical protein